MSFDLQSTDFNAAAVELSYLGQNGPADASQALMAFMGGSMVQEYDAQITAFSTELSSTNAEKEVVRADKTKLTVLEADAKTLTDADGYYDKDGVVYTQQAVVMLESQVEQFIGGAAKLGVAISKESLPTNGNSGYAVSTSIIDSVKDALDNKLSDLNSSSELKAIQFQSLMDSRKQAMLMLSNLINSDNQTKMAIIQNLKG